MVEQRVAALQRRAAGEVEPEEAGERELLGPAFLVHRAFAGQVEGTLHVGDRLPLGRRVDIAGQVPAALVIEPLAESGEDDVVEAPQPVEPAHRCRRLL
jgi:hypothetical protein